MQVGHVEVGVDHLAERAWDGRRRHEQDVWLEAPGLRLQLPSLLDPEPVLLVDDRQAEPREGDRFLEQRVRADHDGRTAVGDLLQGLAPRIGRERAGQKRGRDRELLEERAHGLRVLASEQIGRGEQRPLVARPGA